MLYYTAFASRTIDYYYCFVRPLCLTSLYGPDIREYFKKNTHAVSTRLLSTYPIQPCHIVSFVLFCSVRSSTRKQIPKIQIENFSMQKSFPPFKFYFSVNSFIRNMNSCMFGLFMWPRTSPFHFLFSEVGQSFSIARKLLYEPFSTSFFFVTIR